MIMLTMLSQGKGKPQFVRCQWWGCVCVKGVVSSFWWHDFGAAGAATLWRRSNQPVQISEASVRGSPYFWPKFCIVFRKCGFTLFNLTSWRMNITLRIRPHHKHAAVWRLYTPCHSPYGPYSQPGILEPMGFARLKPLHLRKGRGLDCSVWGRAVAARS